MDLAQTAKNLLIKQTYEAKQSHLCRNSGWPANWKATGYTCQPASALQPRIVEAGSDLRLFAAVLVMAPARNGNSGIGTQTTAITRLQPVLFGAACSVFWTPHMARRMRAVCSCLLHLTLRTSLESLPVKHRHPRCQHVSFPTWGCKVTFWIATSACELRTAPNDPDKVTP